MNEGKQRLEPGPLRPRRVKLQERSIELVVVRVYHRTQQSISSCTFIDCTAHPDPQVSRQIAQIASVEGFRRACLKRQILLLSRGSVSSRYRKQSGILITDITIIRNRPGELK